MTYYCECGKRAIFGKKGTKIAEYCGRHKPKEYVDVCHVMCEKCGEKRATFGDENDKKLRYCFKCKPAECIDVANKMCEECGVARASYGLPNTTMAIYCAECAKILDQGHVLVRGKRCEYNKCITLATFGKEGTIKPIFCVKHVPSTGYYDVINRNKMCKKCNKTRATYGKIGSTTAELCSGCASKELNYVNVVSDKCISCGEVFAAFGKMGFLLYLFLLQKS